MRFALPLAALLFLTTGCPNYVPYLPDGGRARVNCTSSEFDVPVTVLDRAGDPVPLAVVTVDYTSYAEYENVIAKENGVALIKPKYGPGIVRVQGNVNDITTQIGEITFVGGTCSTSVSPRALTLKLR